MRYPGLCIGGPRDRQRVTADRQHFRAAQLPPAPMRLPGASVRAEVVAINFEYQHVPFHFADAGGEGVIGFWVSATERDPHVYVLETLAAAYQKSEAQR